MIRVAICLAALLLSSTAHALECKSSRVGKEYKQWRIIDGRRCWYPSSRYVAKSQLHWPRSKPVTTGAAPKRERDEAETLLRECCWPRR